MQHPIEGRGKDGGGRAPQEAADTLRSTQIAEVLMLISEGECQGLVNGLASVYLDGVPIQSAAGPRNFDVVDFAYSVGSPGQAALPGIAAVQNEQAVGVQVDQATPVVRTIVASGVDHVRVTIGVAQLTYQDPGTGDLVGSSFEWAIDVQANGAGYVQRYRGKVEGKTTSRYNRAVKVELAGSPPWQVRVRRISADPTNAQTVNRFSWDSYTEITSVKLRYPNSAMAWLRVNARYFQRVPVLSLDWLGLRMRVPSNWNPITRAYTGTWDGTLVIAWHNNPAWWLHALCTHERWGLGDLIPEAAVDKWTLYAIARYCDELVSDGQGGQEPRFTCNLVLRSREQAQKVLRDMAAIFRGMIYWANGLVSFSQDAPSDPQLLYTPANVVDGYFRYEDASEKVRHSVCIVWWNDLTQLGKAVPEVYTDETLVQRYGIVELELQPLGLTSRGMAARLARWALYSEQMEGEVVHFAVGSDGVAAGLGKVFKIADPSEAGERLGGRIHAATTTEVTLDADVTLAGGETYSLSVLQPDPANPTQMLAEKRAVSTAAGTTRVLTVASAYSAAPAPQTAWLLESNAVQATTWRCIGVSEVKGKNQYTITGVAHEPLKYDAIENGLVLDPRPISRVTLQPPKPESVSLAETIYRTQGIAKSRVTVSWPEPARGLSYRVSWRLNSGPWTELPAVNANSLDLDGLARGTLDVVVRSVNGLGNASAPAAQSLTVAGGTTYLGLLGATADLTLVGRGGVAVVGNTASKDSGTDGDWSGDAYSTQSYTGGCFASFRIAQTNGAVMVALNRNPTVDRSYSSLDYAIYCDAAGNVQIYEAISGSTAYIGTFGAYAAGDTFSITYDGAYVYYRRGDGSLLTAARSAPPGLTLYLDSSFYYVGTQVTDLRFGPLTDLKPALDAAQAARDVADAAAHDSAVALGALTEIASDSLLTPVEKGAVVQDYAVLSAEQAGIDAQATSYGVTTEKAAYDAALGALSTYLSGLTSPVSWNNLAGNTTIDGAVFRSRFADAYAARQVLLNKIAEVAGTRALWGGVSGTGKPSDNATTDLVLVASSGVTVVGNSATKTAATGDWDQSVYSAHGYVGGCYASAVIDHVGSAVMIGLSASPSTSVSYTNIDHAAFADGAGRVRAYELGGTDSVDYGAYAAGDLLLVQYDGATVKYSRNGVVFKSVAKAAGLRFFLDTSFYHPTGKLTNIRTGPVTSLTQALDAAAAAQGTADTAAGNASNALAQLTDIASDNVLTPGEKSTVVQDFIVISTEQAGIDAQATNYAVTTEKATYDAAIATLTSYLGTLTTPVPWNSLSGNTNIVGATFRTRFSDVYVARQACLDKIAANAKARLGALATLNQAGTTDIVPNAATEVLSATFTSFPSIRTGPISVAAYSFATKVIITVFVEGDITTPGAGDSGSLAFAIISSLSPTFGIILGGIRTGTPQIVYGQTPQVPVSLTQVVHTISFDHPAGAAEDFYIDAKFTSISGAGGLNPTKMTFRAEVIKL